MVQKFAKEGIWLHDLILHAESSMLFTLAAEADNSEMCLRTRASQVSRT